MKKTLLSCMAMFACAGLMANAEVNEPVLSLSFDQNGLVVGGTDAASGTHATRTVRTTTMTFQNVMDGKWLGATDQNGAFAVQYDADDGVGQVFQGGSFTIEFLANVVYNQGYTWDSKSGDKGTSEGGTMKIFGSQQTGGFTFSRKTADGMRFEIGLDKTPDDGKVTNTYYVVKGVNDPENSVDTRFFNLTGKYYQHVGIYDATNHQIKYYVNGSLLFTKDVEYRIEQE